MTTTPPTPAAPLDDARSLLTDLLTHSHHLRALAEDAHTAGQALNARTEYIKLLDLRLRIAGLLQAGPGRPPSRPVGRPTHTTPPPEPALYALANELREVLSELPTDQAATLTALLADLFPALTTPTPPPERHAPPPHEVPGADAAPPWIRGQWRH
ncbi:hypothetical protein [Streptomyces noursei]